MRYLLLFAFLVGCADPFEDTKKVDTIEAWDQYLATSPSGSRQLFAADRLEELMTTKAEASQKPEDFDAILKRFPETRAKKKLQEARVKAALAIATATNTPEGWQKFKDENSFAEPGLLKQAQARVEMAQYTPKLAFTEPVVKQVNLAEDPKGPLNGWGFSTTVTNNGDRTINRLNLEVALLDDKGGVAKAYTYPVVSGSLPGGMPLPDGFDKPIAPGESRAWSYSTGEVPEGWTKQVKLTPIAITLAPI